MRSPGQVRSEVGSGDSTSEKESLQSRHDHSDGEKDLELSGFTSRTLCVSDFFLILLTDLGSAQFRDLPIISQWGEN